MPLQMPTSPSHIIENKLLIRLCQAEDCMDLHTWGTSTPSNGRAFGSGEFMWQPPKPCLGRPLNQCLFQKQHARVTHLPRSIAGTSGGAIVAVFLAAARGSPKDAVGSKLLEILLQMPVDTFVDDDIFTSHPQDKESKVAEQARSQKSVHRPVSPIKPVFNKAPSTSNPARPVSNGKVSFFGGVTRVIRVC